MSTLYVDNLQPNLGSGVSIPGHVVQTVYAETKTPVTLSPNTGMVTLLSLQFTSLNPNNKLLISVHSPNLRKNSGAGVLSWFSSQILVNGSASSEIEGGALGYPENFGDQRYILSLTGIDSTNLVEGLNTVEFQGSVGSSGSDWVFCYQDHTSRLIVQEIGQ